MKHTLAALVILMSAAAFGGTTCSTLIDKNTILCSATIDGVTTYTRQQADESGSEIMTISEATYIALMKADLAAEQAYTEQLKKAYAPSETRPALREGGALDDIKPVVPRLAAGSIHKKKACVKAGYAWKSGVCETQ